MELKKIISVAEIREKVKELGARIDNDYQGKVPLFVCILKGAYVFMSDLLRELNIPCEIDFMCISSYNNSAETSGVVRLVKDLTFDIQKRDVLIIEDIVDTGLTLDYIVKNLKLRLPKSLKVCVLLDKTDARKVDISLDYVGFKVPNVFLVGYGLDFKEHYRNLPYVASIES